MNAPFSRRQPSRVKATWIGSDAAAATCGRTAVGASLGNGGRDDRDHQVEEKCDEDRNDAQPRPVLARESIGFQPLGSGRSATLLRRLTS